MRKFFYQLIGNGIFFAVCVAAMVSWSGQVFASNLLNASTGFLLVLAVLNIINIGNCYSIAKHNRALNFFLLSTVRLLFAITLSWYVLGVALILWLITSYVLYTEAKEHSK